MLLQPAGVCAREVAEQRNRKLPGESRGVPARMGSVRAGITEIEGACGYVARIDQVASETATRASRAPLAVVPAILAPGGQQLTAALDGEP